MARFLPVRLQSTVTDLLHMDEALRNQPCFPARMSLPGAASPHPATAQLNAKLEET
jgi:hypothetical protein